MCLAGVKPTSTSILHGFCKLAELLAYECFRRFGTAQKLPKLGCDFADEELRIIRRFGDFDMMP